MVSSILSPGKNRYTFFWRLGGPQGRSGRAEKPRPRRDSIPDRPARSSVAIPTELPGPHINVIDNTRVLQKVSALFFVTLFIESFKKS